MTNEEAINAINTWICTARRSLKSKFAREFFDAVESMEQKVIRYDWHDLRKNPEDYPKKSGLYWIHGIWGSGKHAEGECEFSIDDGYFRAAWNFNVIA